LVLLLPWTKAGLIEIVPPLLCLDRRLLDGEKALALKDMKDRVWTSSSGILRDEDIGSKGEDLIRRWRRNLPKEVGSRLLGVTRWSRRAVVDFMAVGFSMAASEGFFGSVLTNSTPTTDFRKEWRLFGLWSSKRAELLVQRGLLDDGTWKRLKRETKAGRVWQGLKLERLGALMNLSPEQIIKVRDDSKLSLKSFREELGEKVREIETSKLADEEIGQIVSQVSQDLNKEARSVEKDLKNIKRKIGVSAGLTPLALSLGLLPFSEAKLASMLVGVYSLKDMAGHWVDIQSEKERSGYFLVRLEEEAEEQEVRRRRSDI
jgi:hypothetical protein